MMRPRVSPDVRRLARVRVDWLPVSRAAYVLGLHGTTLRAWLAPGGRLADVEVNEVRRPKMVNVASLRAALRRVLAGDESPGGAAEPTFAGASPRAGDVIELETSTEPNAVDDSSASKTGCDHDVLVARTSGGVELTDERIDELVAEAERGYDVHDLRSREARRES